MSNYKDRSLPSKHQLNFVNESRVKRLRPEVGEYHPDPDSGSISQRIRLPDVTKPPPQTFESLQTFKDFLQNQPDTITATEAQLMYKAYKEKFTRRKAKEFFDGHCEEEWFNEKYHPNISENLKLSYELNKKKRVELFWDLSSTVENLCLDYSHQTDVFKFMEIVATKLEESRRNTDNAKVSNSPRVSITSPLSDSPEYMDIPTVSVETRSLHPFVEFNNNRADHEMDDAVIRSKKKDCNEDVADIIDEIVSKVFKKRDICGFFDDHTVRSGTLTDDGLNGFIEHHPKPTEIEVHKNVSIHLKRVPVSLSRKELDSLLSKYPGYLRLALSEPTQDSDFKTRKAWASFTKDTNVKNICIELADLELGGRDLGAVVNKVLSKKVRINTTVFLAHEKVVRNDIRLASKIIRKMDQEWNLTEEGGNRLLADLAEYLVEVSNAEEDELLGITEDEETKEVFDLVVNQELIRYLDKLILYLRLVHSFDFYNCIEYHHEDDMPNMFGLLHIRGLGTKEKLRRLTIDAHMKSQEDKMRPFMETVAQLTDLEVTALGIRDEDKEVERFVKANIEEIKPGRFLCPLSGKKFKGEDYVRKHIESKFPDRLEQVRNVVKSFNNYLRDRSRPQPRMEKSPVRSLTSPSNNNFRTPPPLLQGPYQDPRGHYGPRGYEDLRHHGGWLDERSSVVRQRVNYHDLDMFQHY